MSNKKTATKKVTTTEKTSTKPNKSGKINILIAGSEVMPFVGTGGLGEVIGSLPKSIQSENANYDVRVIVPYYKDIKQEYRAKVSHIGHTFVDLGWRRQYCGINLLEHEGVKYYFIDNEYYFGRSGLYGFGDDLERFAFFSKAVLEVLPHIGFMPNVIHCNDWQTALIPVYYRTYFDKMKEYKGIKTMFTIHNIEYQGKYDMYLLGDILGLGNEVIPLLQYDGTMNLVKGAIVVSDKVSTVSNTYAGEILTEFFSHGLHYILRANRGKLCGILNGINVDTYNPVVDKSLFANFSADDISNKAENKKQLQQMLGLQVNADAPIIAIISRLVEHKGMDLVLCVLEEILQGKVQFVLLGTGDSKYERYFSALERTYAGKVRSILSFNNDTARKIYGGADIFLMPSKSEPCGLSQMIASRYGTVPIVRETGGLYDSIKDFNIGEDGNGYTFANYNAHDMLYTIKRAIRDYGDRAKWKDKVAKVMRMDFSWAKSAKEYIKVYSALISQ